MVEKGCDNCYYTYFDEKAYPCSLCIRGVERTDMWQPSKKTKADCKTDSNSEKPNNFDKDINVHSKDEPQTCDNCKLKDTTKWCNNQVVCRAYEPMDEPQTEPQTEKVWNAGYKTGYDKGYKDAQKVKDSQDLVKDLVDDEFNPYDEECMRCKHLKLKCEFVPSYCKYELRDEPQTERSSE